MVRNQSGYGGASYSRSAHATCRIERGQKAKADGRWSAAYQSQGKAEPPSDFLAALAANAEAERAFATLDRANRYAFVYRVNDAKRPETRNKRIREFVEMLARGETIHPTKSKRAPRA